MQNIITRTGIVLFALVQVCLLGITGCGQKNNIVNAEDEKCYYNNVFTNLYDSSGLSIVVERGYTIFEEVPGENLLLKLSYVTGSTCQRSPGYMYTMRAEIKKTDNVKTGIEYSFEKPPFHLRLDVLGPYAFQQQMETFGGKFKFIKLSSEEVIMEITEEMVCRFTNQDIGDQADIVYEMRFVKGRYSFTHDVLSRKIKSLK